MIVLPSRTPGLLTLSKPPRLPQRQNQRQTPKPLSKSTPVFRAPLPNSPAKVTDNKKSGVIALPATPSPQPRQVKHTKNRVQNQSPPPTVSSRKSVNRKQHKPLPSLVHAEAIPVPIATRRQTRNISRSDPLPSHMRQRPRPISPLPPFHLPAHPVPLATRRQTPNISHSDPLPSHIRQRTRPVSAIPSTYRYFPICDDMNDVADFGGPTTNEKHSEREAAEKAAGYFASSMFQNSPSPEELPDPPLF